MSSDHYEEKAMSKLIVITHEAFISGEADALNLLPVIASTLPISSTQTTCLSGFCSTCGGIELFIHLRKPSASMDEVRELLKQLTDEALQMIVLHDHFQLTNEFPVAGIHRNAKNEAQFNDYTGLGLIETYASHSFDEISISEGFSYYWLSPIFDSISKTGYQSNFNFNEVQSFLAENPEKQIIALGGITDLNARQCIDAGFSGIAVLGWLWNSFLDGGLPEFEKKLNKLLLQII